MSSLAAFIEGNREEVVQLWAKAHRERAASEPVDPEVAIDSLREFLDEIVTALRAGSANPGSDAGVRATALARGHGIQRFRLGFDLFSVVRDYALVNDVLHEMLDRTDHVLERRELYVFSTMLMAAIADAANQYSYERDAQLRDQAARHMGFLAHEVRNPLSSAVLTLELAQRRGDVPTAPWVDRVTGGVNRAHALIDRALNLVRLKSAQQLEPRHLVIAELVNEAAEEARASAELRGITIQIEGADGDVECDRPLLYSAISNLIRNAVKFTRDGERIRIASRVAAGRVLVEVEDRCGGLPEGATARLFDPFVQAGVDRSGLGLGLAITKSAAEAHGGTIRVHNLDGRGCVFVLDLPARARTPHVRNDVTPEQPA